MTIEEYEDALNEKFEGALLGKRFLTLLASIASAELREPVEIEQARVSVQDRRLRIFKKTSAE